jgi:hypothetical protein
LPRVGYVVGGELDGAAVEGVEVGFAEGEFGHGGWMVLQQFRRECGGFRSRGMTSVDCRFQNYESLE